MSDFYDEVIDANSFIRWRIGFNIDNGQHRLERVKWVKAGTNGFPLTHPGARPISGYPDLWVWYTAENPVFDPSGLTSEPVLGIDGKVLSPGGEVLDWAAWSDPYGLPNVPPWTIVDDIGPDDIIDILNEPDPEDEPPPGPDPLDPPPGHTHQFPDDSLSIEFEFVHDGKLSSGWREVSPSEHSLSDTPHVVPYDGRLRWVTFACDAPHGGVEVAIKHNGPGTLAVHTFTAQTDVWDVDLPVAAGDTLLIHARPLGDPKAEDIIVVIGMEA